MNYTRLLTPIQSVGTKAKPRKENPSTNRPPEEWNITIKTGHPLSLFSASSYSPYSPLRSMIRELKVGSKNLLQVGRLLDEYVLRRGVCSMSASIYDTAWVSMVQKGVENGKKIWLFPQSFEFICDQQQSHGGWEGGDEIDMIVNSLASLLALKKHQKEDPEEMELDGKIQRAVEFLTTKMKGWDISRMDQVAFEVLIPSMLDLLEQEGVKVEFPDSDALRQRNQNKMSKVQVSVLYKYPSRIIHSLESLIGIIDFDRMGKYMKDGSMGGSPASTAAYLMNASKWSESAERYLQDAIENGSRLGDGAVTTVFPISTFEFAWSTCNILENGLEVDAQYNERIGNILAGYLEEGKGLAGFDPSTEPDADDTAKTITALQLMGYKVTYDALIENFEKETYFQCFPHESAPSFSANCNILSAFCHAPEPSEYLSQIIKCIQYICYEWWNSDEPIRDKWNLSIFYPSLLAAQALVRVLYLYETNSLAVPERLIRVKVMVVLFQIMSRVLQHQNEDGSWGTLGSREETSYAILTLANVSSLPFLNPVAGQIESSVSRGRKYLKSIKALEEIKLTPVDYIWGGKVSYGVENVCHSYVLAALNTPIPQYLLGPRVSGLVNIPQKRVSSFTKFYGKLPMFSEVESWKLKLWLMEGYLFLPDLERMRVGVFSRNGEVEDKYFEYLPFSWTGPNGLEDIQVGAQTLFDMMMISMINYQVDEFFDGVVSNGDLKAISELRYTIESLFSKRGSSKQQNGVKNGQKNGTGKGLMTDFYEQLDEFCQFVLSYPRIQNASTRDKTQLELELKAYLLAHTQQCEDSIRLRRLNSKGISSGPNTSYIRWVQTIATDHLSSRYAFAFLTCLLGNNEEDYLPNAEVRYIAQDCCTHLSVVCRMFNDYGSLDRDLQEAHMNSLFFPEFGTSSEDGRDGRNELVRLAQYERKLLSLAFEELENACGTRYPRIYQIMRLFYNANEIYTEVYEIRDPSSWV